MRMLDLGQCPRSLRDYYRAVLLGSVPAQMRQSNSTVRPYIRSIAHKTAFLWG
jgi:hypothetical protein